MVGKIKVARIIFVRQLLSTGITEAQLKFISYTSRASTKVMAPFYLDPAQLCQAFFVLASAAALGGNAIPILRQGLISYGARSMPTSEGLTPCEQNNKISTIILD